MTDKGNKRAPRKKRKLSSYVAAPPGDTGQLVLAIRNLLEQGEEDAPTLAQFAPRFLSEYATANRHKPRGVEHKESCLRIHLIPRFGGKPLNRLNDADVAALKASMAEGKGKRHPKTVNNVLTVLSTLLRVAVKWKVLARMPVEIHQLPVQLPKAAFYDYAEYQRLCETAQHGDLRWYAAIRLGGDGGLRLGELSGLEWPDCDIQHGLIHVQRSVSQGEVTAPKGGRSRTVPMTDALATALAALFPSRLGKRVLTRDSGADVSEQVVKTWIEKVERLAGFVVSGRVHILRHTFCSHLAMRGAPLIAIKELAGHQSERTTMRYMHLAPSEKSRAIELLNERSDNGGQIPSGGTEWPRQGSNLSGTSAEGGSRVYLPGDTGANANATRGEDCPRCWSALSPCPRHSPTWTPSGIVKIPGGK